MNTAADFQNNQLLDPIGDVHVVGVADDAERLMNVGVDLRADIFALKAHDLRSLRDSLIAKLQQTAADIETSFFEYPIFDAVDGGLRDIDAHSIEFIGDLHLGHLGLSE